MPEIICLLTLRRETPTPENPDTLLKRRRLTSSLVVFTQHQGGSIICIHHCMLSSYLYCSVWNHIEFDYNVNILPYSIAHDMYFIKCYVLRVKINIFKSNQNLLLTTAVATGLLNYSLVSWQHDYSFKLSVYVLDESSMDISCYWTIESILRVQGAWW